MATQRFSLLSGTLMLSASSSLCMAMNTCYLFTVSSCCSQGLRPQSFPTCLLYSSDLVFPSEAHDPQAFKAAPGPRCMSWQACLGTLKFQWRKYQAQVAVVSPKMGMKPSRWDEGSPQRVPFDPLSEHMARWSSANTGSAYLFIISYLLSNTES